MYDTATKALESFGRISGGGGPAGGSNHHQQLLLEDHQEEEQHQPFQPFRQQQLQQFQQQQPFQQQFQQFQLPPPRPRAAGGGLGAGGEVGGGRGIDNALFSFLAPLPPPRPAPEWGTSHRYYRSQATRVPFGRAEITYLQTLLEENPHIRTSGRMVAMALAHIRRDRDRTPGGARAIFHERHVMNTTRLKTGFAALERAKAAARAGDPWGSDEEDVDGGEDDGAGDAYADTPPSSSSSSSSSSRPLRFFND